MPKTRPHIRVALLIAALTCAALATARGESIDTVGVPTSVDNIVGELYDDPDQERTLGYNTGLGHVQVGEVGSAYSPGINRVNENSVVGFTLPTLSGGPDVTEVAISFRIRRYRDDGNDLGDLQVYLMDTTDPTSDIPPGIDNSDPDDPVDWFYDGNGDDARSGVELFGQFNEPAAEFNTANGDDAVDTILTINSGDALTLFQSFYGGDATPDQTEAFFRFNTNSNITVGGGSSEYEVVGGTGDYSPTLDITSTPEPATLALLGLAAMLCLSSRKRRI